MRIPEKFQKSFQRLATMKEGDFNRLKEALANTQPTFDIETFAERVASKDEGLSAAEISDLVGAVAPLMSSAEQEDVEEFAEWVSTTVQGNEKLDMGKDDAANLVHRLHDLFAFDDTLGTVAKARAIYFFQGNDFCGAKIVTDVRPIFRSDPNLDPVAAVLVHTLQIGYHRIKSQEHQDFTIMLDEDELDELQEAIERARAKAKTLVRITEKAGMRCLKPRQDNGD